MIQEIFTNGTETLYIYRNDDDPHDCMFYVDTDKYGGDQVAQMYSGDEGCRLPVFKCSDSWISYMFGLTSRVDQKAVQLNEEDTALVIENILKDSTDNYKPNAVIFGEFQRKFQGYTINIIFSPQYYLWKLGEDNQYYDEKIGRVEFNFTLSPIEYLYALIKVVIPDEEVQQVIFNQLEM